VLGLAGRAGGGERVVVPELSIVRAAAWAVARRTWTTIFRRPVVLTFSFAQPLLWMMLFGFLMQRYPTTEVPHGTDYLTFLVPGVCAMTVLFGASQSGISLIRDHQTGFLRRMLATPTPAWSILGGKLFADVSRLFVQALIVLAMGLGVGARYPWPSWSLLVAFFGLISLGLLLSSLSCIIAAKARVPETMGAYVHLVNMPLLFTSTALVPDRSMPSWLRQVAELNPISLCVDGLRGALVMGAMPSVSGLVALFGVAMGLFALGAVALARLRSA